MNNYIYEYYQKITDGTIIVSRWIKVWYKYVVDGLEKGLFHFDPKKRRKQSVLWKISADTMRVRWLPS